MDKTNKEPKNALKIDGDLLAKIEKGVKVYQEYGMQPSFKLGGLEDFTNSPNNMSVASIIAQVGDALSATKENLTEEELNTLIKVVTENTNDLISVPGISNLAKSIFYNPVEEEDFENSKDRSTLYLEIPKDKKAGWSKLVSDGDPQVLANRLIQVLIFYAIQASDDEEGLEDTLTSMANIFLDARQTFNTMAQAEEDEDEEEE